MISATLKALIAALAIFTLAASASASGGGGHAAPATEEGPAIKAVSLGQYLISDLRAVEGAKLRVSFELYLDADDEHSHELRELVSAYKHRIRSEVITAIRTCEQAEFEEPDLDRMRSRIIVRLKRALPELPIEKLFVGAFQYFNE
jgi:flagellar basal body-associated protein FliL